MEPLTDTIAAVATAPGQAGIAVVRISGPDSLAIADKTLRTKGRSPSKSESPALLHGLFCWKSEIIDEVLMLIMRAPRSYTREDVVEIQCHGGSVVSRRILRSVLNAGARLAGPGEFTMRAFMNGRLDLLQAEAVADIINAHSNRAASAAIEQLKGGLSDRIESIYAQVIELAAAMEAGLDFPDDELPPVSREAISDGIDNAANELERLIDTHEEGRLLRQGARVVISGKPNVGKSTLLNRLLAAERAIVSHLPGTTRDTIEEHIIIDGFPLIITDTAGLRSTECEIEEEGIRRTKAMIDNADLHIYLTDSRFPIDEEDREYLGSHNSRKTILVRNKTDLGPRRADPFPGIASIDASLINGNGLDDIRKKIAEIIEADISLSSDPHATISERHFKVLNNAYENLATAKGLVIGGKDGHEVLSASNLRDAAEAIGEVLGKNYHQELLDSIFGKFCIGK